VKRETINERANRNYSEKRLISRGRGISAQIRSNDLALVCIEEGIAMRGRVAHCRQEDCEGGIEARHHRVARIRLIRMQYAAYHGIGGGHKEESPSAPAQPSAPDLDAW
jgi:hypothetical protein